MNRQSREKWGLRVLREPKGEPDAVLIGDEKNLPTVYRTADILSVQGYTACLLLLYEPQLFMQARDRLQTVFQKPWLLLSEIALDLPEFCLLQATGDLETAKEAARRLTQQLRAANG